ncbi:hypothetical protein [Bradyrhizobium sp. 145]|uniref:hypothetical protein n=1 Tax=Bradyrhizobium sp. 145 TaxID=2782621 RepID=UPI001FF73BC8|nr:hypothetical protein [Bradyrhizobium sp. 145]
MKPAVAKSGRDLAWTAGGEGQQDRENDNADTSLKSDSPCISTSRLQVPLHFERTHDRHRIGQADEAAKHQRQRQRQRLTKETSGLPE